MLLGIQFEVVSSRARFGGHACRLQLPLARFPEQQEQSSIESQFGDQGLFGVWVWAHFAWVRAASGCRD